MAVRQSVGSSTMCTNVPIFGTTVPIFTRIFTSFFVKQLKNHENGGSRFCPVRIIGPRLTDTTDFRSAVMNLNLRTACRANGKTLPVSGNDFPDAFVPDGKIETNKG
jgi:hypothetical protein